MVIDRTHELEPATLSSPSSRGPFLLALQELRRHRLATASLGFIGAITLLAIAAPLVTSSGYADAVFPPLEPPNRDHVMGTDGLGRDVWSRIVYGARISLAVGFGSQVVAAAIGIPLGAIAGFAGGRIDKVLMRLTDIMLALPAILLALLFLTVFGSSAVVVAFAIGLATWPMLARVVRSRVLTLKNTQFVEASYSVGCLGPRVIGRHILPHTLGPVIVQVTFGISLAIYAEAFLAFLGLGAQPPTPSWGRLIVDGFEFVRTSPYLTIFPAAAITLTILALNSVGDGLRDAFSAQDS